MLACVVVVCVGEGEGFVLYKMCSKSSSHHLFVVGWCAWQSLFLRPVLFRLFSRVEPAHKSKIVGYLQEDGAISAMVRAHVCVCGVCVCVCVCVYVCVCACAKYTVYIMGTSFLKCHCIHFSSSDWQVSLYDGDFLFYTWSCGNAGASVSVHIVRFLNLIVWSFLDWWRGQRRARSQEGGNWSGHGLGDSRCQVCFRWAVSRWDDARYSTCGQFTIRRTLSKLFEHAVWIHKLTCLGTCVFTSTFVAQLHQRFVPSVIIWMTGRMTNSMFQM